MKPYLILKRIIIVAIRIIRIIYNILERRIHDSLKFGNIPTTVEFEFGFWMEHLPNPLEYEYWSKFGGVWPPLSFGRNFNESNDKLLESEYRARDYLINCCMNPFQYFRKLHSQGNQFRYIVFRVESPHFHLHILGNH